MEQMQSMESESKVFTSENYHTLNDKWVLWAHLPHDTDWTLKSYKEIYENGISQEDPPFMKYAFTNYNIESKYYSMTMIYSVGQFRKIAKRRI